MLDNIIQMYLHNYNVYSSAPKLVCVDDVASCVFTATLGLFQFRYKRRVYIQTYLDDKQLSKLHTKVRE